MIKLRRAGLLVLTAFLFSSAAGYAQQKNNFIFTQLKYRGDWDPYPEIYREILGFLVTTTSIKTLPQRRVVSLKDKELFAAPFLIILGRDEFPKFSAEERDLLGRYINGGGFIFVEDVSGRRNSAFRRGFSEEFSRVLSESELRILPREHAIYRSFYLLRAIGGRKIVNTYVEGFDYKSRTVVIFSQNDTFGAWARDPMGNYLYDCTPGGEKQRLEAEKMTMNIILYALTGTYKTDAIHSPFIKEKLRQ